jgi:protein gp37
MQLMAFGSDIEWTESTWNPVTGCDKVSPGCKHCYAERMAERLQAMGQANYKDGFKLTLQPNMLELPLRWKKPRKIFVNSMSDLFHEDVPFEYIAAVFGVMAATARHTYTVCTKRARRMREWFEWLESECTKGRISSHGPIGVTASLAADVVGEEILIGLLARTSWPLPNVWLLVSTENQQTFDERVPELLQCSAAVRGVSAEPLLGPIDITQLHSVWDKHGEPSGPREGSFWVIVGGESGPKARPCDVGWIRSIVEQCKEAGVACFVKQLGAQPLESPVGLRDRKGGDPSEWPEDLRVRWWPEGEQ